MSELPGSKLKPSPHDEEAPVDEHVCVTSLQPPPQPHPQLAALTLGTGLPPHGPSQPEELLELEEELLDEELLELREEELLARLPLPRLGELIEDEELDGDDELELGEEELLELTDDDELELREDELLEL